MKWKSNTVRWEISENGDGQKRRKIWSVCKEEERKKGWSRMQNASVNANTSSVGAHLIASAPQDTIDRTSDFQLAMWLIYLSSRKRERVVYSVSLAPSIRRSTGGALDVRHASLEPSLWNKMGQGEKNGRKEDS